MTDNIKSYPGLKVDIEKLSKGFYNLIKEHPDGACLRLGMFPHDIMNFLEKGIKAKLHNSDSYTLIAYPEHTYKTKETIEAVVHDVCCKILQLATDEGYCIV